MNATEEKAQMCDRDSWSGKTSPEHSAVTKAQTSRLSSKKPSKSSSKKLPIFLCLTKDGQQPEHSATWTDDGAWRGAFSTHDTGESPNAAVESRLSQILEANPHPRYCLSAKACSGILRRAERRGKVLPPMLKEALEQMIARELLG